MNAETKADLLKAAEDFKEVVGRVQPEQRTILYTILEALLDLIIKHLIHGAAE